MALQAALSSLLSAPPQDMGSLDPGAVSQPQPSGVPFTGGFTPQAPMPGGMPAASPAPFAGAAPSLTSQIQAFAPTPPTPRTNAGDLGHDGNYTPDFAGVGSVGGPSTMLDPETVKYLLPVDTSNSYQFQGGPQGSYVSPGEILKNQMQQYSDMAMRGQGMMQDAYGRPIPQNPGPKFGIQDLLFGLLPALLMGDHKGGLPSAGLQFATGYLGGKEQHAQQDYQRTMDQFQRGEQSQLQAGQSMVGQAERGIGSATQQYHWNTAEEDRTQNNLVALDAQLIKAKPEQIPVIIASMNNLRQKLGRDNEVQSPDDIQQLMQAANTRENWFGTKGNNGDASAAAKAFNDIMNSKDQASRQTAVTALQMYMAKYPDKIGDILGAGGTADQIQQLLSQVPMAQQVQESVIAKNKAAGLMYNANTGLKNAQTQTVNAIRVPTVNEIIAKQGVYDSTSDEKDAMANMLGIRADALPAQLKAQTAALQGQANVAAARVNQINQDIQDSKQGINAPEGKAGLPYIQQGLTKGQLAQANLNGTMAYENKAAGAIGDMISALDRYTQAKNDNQPIPKDAYVPPTGVDPSTVKAQLQYQQQLHLGKAAEAKSTYDSLTPLIDSYQAKIDAMKQSRAVAAPPTYNGGMVILPDGSKMQGAIGGGSQKSAVADLSYVGGLAPTDMVPGKSFTVHDALQASREAIARHDITRDQAIQKLRAMKVAVK